MEQALGLAIGAAIEVEGSKAAAGGVSGAGAGVADWTLVQYIMLMNKLKREKNKK